MCISKDSITAVLNFFMKQTASFCHESFKQDLETACTKILSSTTCKASAYFDELSSVLDCHAPVRERRVTDRPSLPWMTAEIKSLKAEKRRAERKWRKSRLSRHLLCFKEIVFKLKRMISSS